MKRWMWGYGTRIGVLSLGTAVLRCRSEGFPVKVSSARRKRVHGAKTRPCRVFVCTEAPVYLKSPHRTSDNDSNGLRKGKVLLNILVPARRRAVLACLLEGCSIRATSRLTDVHKTTIMRLLVDAGEHCQNLLDEHLRNLPCRAIEADEIWTFVRKKQYRLRSDELSDPEVGDQYTFVAFDPYSKLVAAHLVGRRDDDTAAEFILQLQRRVRGRIHLSTDGFGSYVPAVDNLYGADIDYVQVIKPRDGTLHVRQMTGEMDPILTCTSYVERQNLTMRQHIRRFTRKTLGFSKKLRNLRAAVALYFAWYNWCRPHSSLSGATPAMALGISNTFWSVDRLLP